jgi:peptidoglycan/LPS O-acetylase OafA/YrhL
MLNSIAIGSSLHSEKYRPDIDGLRAIAVIAVVICHAFPSLIPGGFVGVDIFFVISGYLISSIIIRDIDKHRFSILAFYDRRIRRIFPALIFILVAAAIFGWLFLFNAEFRALGRHLIASTLFYENFKLLSESGYFDSSSDGKPLLHLWSLSIEEQFYVFWPILLYVARKRHVQFLLILLTLGLASFAINIFELLSDPISAYLSPLGRFWELMLGALLAYTQAYHPRLLQKRQNIQSIIGFILIFASLILINPKRDFPGFWALLPTAGAFLAISAGGDAWINRRVLSATPFVWIGLISYPLYLWHWVLLSYGHILFGKMPPSLRLAILAAATVAAIFTFLFVERPFRMRSRGVARPLGLGAGMAAVLSLAVLIAAQVIPARLNSFEAPTRDAWQFLRVKSGNFNRDAAGVYELHPERRDVALFIGDSHLAQYAERLDRSIGGDPTRPGAVMALGGGCIPIEDVWTRDLTRKKCWALRERAFQMAREERFKTIVIGGAWKWYFLDDAGYFFGSDPDRLRVNSAAGEAAGLAQLGQTISQLVRAGKRVILVLDNPSSNDFDPLDADNRMFAKARFSLSGGNFAGNRVTIIDAAQFELRDRMANLARQAGASVIDPLAAVCRRDQCWVTAGSGQPVYGDENHFNPDWAITHADFIDAATLR